MSASSYSSSVPSERTVTACTVVMLSSQPPKRSPVNSVTWTWCPNSGSTDTDRRRGLCMIFILHLRLGLGLGREHARSAGSSLGRPCGLLRTWPVVQQAGVDRPRDEVRTVASAEAVQRTAVVRLHAVHPDAEPLRGLGLNQAGGRARDDVQLTLGHRRLEDL